MRNDGQQELGAIDRVHGQAGAVDGDRAFMGDVLGQVLWRADAEFHGARIFGTGNHFAHAVDVTADQMPAEASGRGQGFFQIDRAAAFQVVHGGAVEGFATDVRRKAIARQFNGSQAHAVDRDAVAQFDVAQVELAGFDVNPHITALWGQCTNTADGFDDAGKHEVLLENKASAIAMAGNYTLAAGTGMAMTRQSSPTARISVILSAGASFICASGQSSSGRAEEPMNLPAMNIWNSSTNPS
ncbi:hypothetical protein D9M71_383180 [compost metagenome]